MKLPTLGNSARLGMAFTSIALGACAVAGDTTEETPGTQLSSVTAKGAQPIVGLAGKCLDDNADGTADGSKVQLYTCNGSAAQKWTLEAGTLVGPGGKCLDVSDNQQANNTIVQLWTCNGTSAQKWTIAGGQIKSAGGYCLNVRNATATDGTQVELYDCVAGAPSEKWAVGSSGPGGGGGTTSSSSSSSGGTGGSTGSDATMPTGDRPGWHLIYTDAFDGNTLGSEWSTAGGFQYLGGHDYVSNDHTTVHDGVLDMKFSWENTPNGYLPTTGWAMLKGAAVQQYGKYLVRLRADATPSVAIDALLWPNNEVWPPEVDFFEDDNGSRSPINAFTHYSAQNQQTWHTVDTSATAWHTFGVEWAPGSLTFTLDGQPWGKDQGSTIVPSTPMWLGFNQVIFPGAADPPQTEGHFLVDWVAVFSPAP